MRFLIFLLVFFYVLNDVGQNVAVVFDYPKPRCYYSCPYAVVRKFDAIIRIRMLLGADHLTLEGGGGGG